MYLSDAWLEEIIILLSVGLFAYSTENRFFHVDAINNGTNTKNRIKPVFQRNSY